MAIAQTRTSSSDTADNMIRVTERLTSLMVQEVDLLRGRRARDIKSLQGDKESLASVYQRMMQDLQANPALLEGLDDGRKNALMRAAHKLEEAAGDNAIALHSAIQANHRLMEAIADAVQERNNENAPYARNGRLAGAVYATNRATAAPALALNQTL